MFRLIEYVRERMRHRLRYRMRMSIDEMEERKYLFSKIYMLSSMILAGLVTYMAYQEDYSKKDPNMSQEERVAKEFGKNKLRVIHYSGFEKVSDYMYEADKSKELKNSEDLKSMDGFENVENYSENLENVENSSENLENLSFQ